MPLYPNVRRIVNDYLFKHIVPKHVRPRPRTAMEWFVDRFAFIDDETLRKHLAEALYQARYLGRFHEALDLRGDFNRAFIKAQVALYASIFEAIIDYYLDKNFEHPAVVKLLTQSEFVPLDALASDISLSQKHVAGDIPLAVCKMKSVKRPLHLAQFSDRVDAAHSIGLVPAAMVEFLKTLYQSRNAIHVLNAARKDLKPDAKESSEAFEHIKSFLKHAASWAPKKTA
ncbi:MAG: hypothetical protein U0570_05945 [Phycisphaerales bacterium]